MYEDALQEYDTGLTVPVGVQPLPIYVDLAWSGVWAVGNTNFNSVLTSTDKAGILNRKNTEMEKTTSYGMIPSSNDPCLH